MTYPLSDRSKNLKQSGIRSASARCNEIGGINLGQGICDLPVPDEIIQATEKVIHDNNSNTYSDCQGIKTLRDLLSEKISTFNRIPTTPSQIIVGHGSTGVFTCAAMTLFNPGDEVILFEPFYGYHKNVLDILNIQIKTVAISLDDFSIDFDALKNAITPKTKGIVVCTPCNPCGKVFTKEELIHIGRLAKEHNMIVLTDEIYEYISYPGHEHVSLASLEDFRNHTITLSGFSKTYNMTGWRLGYASGPEEIIAKMALVQDYLYICPVTPLQHGLIAALQLPQTYYENMRATYLRKRDFVVNELQKIGFDLCEPQGAYYIMADFSKLGFKNDLEAVETLLNKTKVATVTGSSFYLDPIKGQNHVRFCYALNEEKLSQAMKQLQQLTK